MATKLSQLLNIKHPIIQAPMFLVSNTTMVIEAMKGGIAGCIPALNYRTLDELRVALKELKVAKVDGGSFGFNLIVNKCNGDRETLLNELNKIEYFSKNGKKITAENINITGNSFGVQIPP